MRFSKRSDPETIKTLTRCIQELEARTRAEVVLVLRQQSGNYRDLDYLFAAGVTFAVLLVKLFSPWEFHPLSVPLPLILTFLVAARLSHALRFHGPRRWLSREQRRVRQVRQAAAACFHEKRVGRTQSRCGILLYYSALERRGELLADQGAEAALGDRLEEFRTRLNSACSDSRTVEGSFLGLAGFLRSFGVHLGKILPNESADESKNELSDTPDLGGDPEEEP